MTSHAEAIAPMVAFMGLIINRYIFTRQRVSPAQWHLRAIPTTQIRK